MNHGFDFVWRWHLKRNIDTKGRYQLRLWWEDEYYNKWGGSAKIVGYTFAFENKSLMMECLSQNTC